MDWSLVALVVGVSLPGILVVVPQLVPRMESTLRERSGIIRPLPSTTRLVLVSAGQSLLLVLPAAVVGAYAAPRVGFDAPVFEAVIARGDVVGALSGLLLPVVGYSIGGSVVLFLTYYGLFRPRLDPTTVEVMESLRMDLGVGGRVLYGGVVEEILVRWGLQSLVALLGMLALGAVTPAVIWGAIVVSGVVFGLGHLPAYVPAGCRFTPLFLAFTVVLNLWASLLFGWLFW